MMALPMKAEEAKVVLPLVPEDISLWNGMEVVPISTRRPRTGYWLGERRNRASYLYLRCLYR